MRWVAYTFGKIDAALMIEGKIDVNWDALFAARTQQMKRSTVREILKLTARPEVISFAGGLPAEELFPVQNNPRNSLPFA